MRDIASESPPRRSCVYRSCAPVPAAVATASAAVAPVPPAVALSLVVQAVPRASAFVGPRICSQIVGKWRAVPIGRLLRKRGFNATPAGGRPSSRLRAPLGEWPGTRPSAPFTLKGRGSAPGARRATRRTQASHQPPRTASHPLTLCFRPRRKPLRNLRRTRVTPMSHLCHTNAPTAGVVGPPKNRGDS